MIFVLRQVQVTASANVKKLAFILLLAVSGFIVYFNFESVFILYYDSRNQSLDVTQFVSFDVSVEDGRRLGNQMFALAAVIYVSQLTGRKPVLQNSTHLLLEDVFQLDFERVDDICPCFELVEGRHLSYEEEAEDKVFNSRMQSVQSIRVSGFRQSWKYTRTIDRRLRRYLLFKDDILNVAETFLENIIPAVWKRAGFVRVGIHVRRGDILSPGQQKYGYTIPNETYFQNGIGYFVEKYGRVQFIVASDDFNWTRKHVVVDRYSPDSVNMTYSLNHTAGQDLALLSMCDHVIMSTGTFGWWAAWLAKGTTIYYRDWPRRGSDLDWHFKREDFFPPTWIPMSD